MSMDGQGTKWRRKIAENFNRLSRAHQRYKQTRDDRQTDRHKDGTAIAYAELEQKFTFAKNYHVQECYRRLPSILSLEMTN